MLFFRSLWLCRHSAYKARLLDLVISQKFSSEGEGSETCSFLSHMCACKHIYIYIDVGTLHIVDIQAFPWRSLHIGFVGKISSLFSIFLSSLPVYIYSVYNLDMQLSNQEVLILLTNNYQIRMWHEVLSIHYLL